MKKFKLFNILLIMIMALAMPIVYAHDVTVSNYIKIPEIITASTKIEVEDDFGEYELYYQWVAMDQSDYDSYRDLLKAQLELTNPGENASQDEKDAYDEELMEYEASKIALKPAYIEEKWVKSEDGTVPFNESLEGIEENAPYVLWINAVSKEDSNNQIYQERLILYNTNLVSDDIENAKTSDSILVIGLLTVAAIGFMTISYKKSRA